jgi:hypothetical protein
MPYGQVPVAIQGNVGLGIATLVLGGVLVACSVLQALTAPAAARAYDRTVALGYLPGPAYALHQLLGGLSVVVVPLWIVGSIWLYRAHFAAFALVSGHMRRAPHWSWLGWVVPVVNLWFPKQILDDVWRAAGSRTLPTSPGRQRSTDLMWGLWLTYNVLYGLAHLHFWSSANGDPNTLAADNAYYMSHPVIHPPLEILGAVVGIAAYVAWVRVVRGISAAQEELTRRPFVQGPVPY